MKINLMWCDLNTYYMWVIALGSESAPLKSNGSLVYINSIEKNRNVLQFYCHIGGLGDYIVDWIAHPAIL